MYCNFTGDADNASAHKRFEDSESDREKQECGVDEIELPFDGQTPERGIDGHEHGRAEIMNHQRMEDEIFEAGQKGAADLMHIPARNGKKDTQYYKISWQNAPGPTEHIGSEIEVILQPFSMDFLAGLQDGEVDAEAGENKEEDDTILAEVIDVGCPEGGIRPSG